ncbi:MAG TPA: hypothetical protein VHX64_09285, partial [Caulobacteraceae bacterium]|nr:hypothetical protein [Caulobacteraceae bacterium]
MPHLFGRASALAVVAGLSVAGAAAAQEASSVDEVIVTGTRVSGLKAADSPAPIQVLGAQALARVGSPGL